MYDIIYGKDKGGIPGYICPKKYFDYHACIWLKKREEILKKHKAVWPPDSWKVDKETVSAATNHTADRGRYPAAATTSETARGYDSGAAATIAL